MVSLDIWLIYFFITAVSGAIFYFIEYKVASDNVIFSILKGISALTFCCTGIAFLFINLIIVLDLLSPYLPHIPSTGSSTSDDLCDPDPLFGGC